MFAQSCDTYATLMLKMSNSMTFKTSNIHVYIFLILFLSFSEFAFSIFRISDLHVMECWFVIVVSLPLLHLYIYIYIYICLCTRDFVTQGCLRQEG